MTNATISQLDNFETSKILFKLENSNITLKDVKIENTNTI